jgi:hypothetical protein
VTPPGLSQRGPVLARTPREGGPAAGRGERVVEDVAVEAAAGGEWMDVEPRGAH